jgi:hypothetical protein
LLARLGARSGRSGALRTEALKAPRQNYRPASLLLLHTLAAADEARLPTSASFPSINSHSTGPSKQMIPYGP